MDDQNVQHFWGISPSVDLLALCNEGVYSAADGTSDAIEPIRVLQVASYDARHTLQTLCHLARHGLISPRHPVHLYVHEEEPEALSRHMLLLAVLLGGAGDAEPAAAGAGTGTAATRPLLGRERAELLLELHGNALLREKAARHLDRQGKLLEELVTALSSGTVGSISDKNQDAAALQRLASLVDISQLKFQERDALVETFKQYREQFVYDMIKGWDARSRKWYAERFDFRKNMIDWDYHMRLQPLGTPGQDVALGSIIHFHHFRYWRMHGIAHELRDSVYNQANRSLVSTAYGRTKDFKDRSGKDVGRSVSARGFWADILNGPYHCFGTVTEEARFYIASNKVYSHTAMDVASHNAQALLTELRTGKPPIPLAVAARIKAARGPTSMEDLQDEASKDEAAALAATAAAASQSESGAAAADAAAAAGPAPDGDTDAAGNGRPGRGWDAAPTGPSRPRPASIPEGPDEEVSGADSPSAAAAAAAATDMSVSEQSAEVPALEEDRPDEATSSAPQPDSKDDAETAVALVSDVQAKMVAEDSALRAEEAALDAAAWARLQGCARVIFLTGDLTKQVTSRAKYAGAFDVISVGHRHVHMVSPEHGLQRVAKPTSALLVENARYLLQLKADLGDQFSDKVRDMARAAGWEPTAAPMAVVTAAHLVFHRAP